MLCVTYFKTNILCDCAATIDSNAGCAGGLTYVSGAKLLEDGVEAAV